MSKGVGGIGKGALSRTIGKRIAAVGGISHAEYLREGFRPGSLAYWRAVYAGKTPAQAQRIAASLKEPVKIGVGSIVEVEDGRHRMTAAKEAGATSIRARVRVYGTRGGASRTWVGLVKL